MRYRGVREWPRGHYTAEIRDLSMKSPVWLKTFDRAEGVARACDTKVVEFYSSKAKTNFLVPSSVIDLNRIILSKANVGCDGENERPSQSSTV